jgi:hypothetical protein
MAHTPDQVLCASRAWLEAVRRGLVKRRPDEECWLPTWEALSAGDRIFIMNVMTAALTASEPANVRRSMERDLGKD